MNNNTNNKNNNTNTNQKHTEQDLINLAKNGDEQAFEHLINSAIPKIRAGIKNVYKHIDAADIEDAESISMQKAWQKIKNFKTESAFSTWFYSIFKNEVLTIINTKKNLNAKEISIESIGATTNSDNLYDKFPLDLMSDAVTDTAQSILEKKEQIEEFKQMLDYVLDKLSPEHKNIINLVLKDNKSYKEASAILNLPLGSIMSRLYNARKQAKRILATYSKRENIDLGFSIEKGDY